MLASKTSILKRIGSTVFDFFIIFIITFTLQAFVFTPIFDKAAHYEENQNSLTFHQISSGLFVVVDDQQKIELSYENIQKDHHYNIKNGYMFNIKNLIYNTEYDSSTYYKHLREFYFQYDNLETFNNLAKENSSLVLENGEYVFSNVSEEEKLSFLDTVFNQASIDIAKYKDGIIPSLEVSISSTRLTILLSSIFTSMLLYLVFIPLMMKNRNTLGQKIMNLTSVDQYYVKLRWYNLLLRMVTIFLLDVVLGILSFYLVVIVDVIFALFLKNGKTLHDLISFTQVIDLNEIDPFLTYKDFRDFVQNEEVNTKDTMRKPYAN